MKGAPLPLRFAMIAGESSGDTLGADLIRYLKQDFPQAIFEGIGGKRMIAEGFQSFFPLERLSVMGFFEPLKRLPELIAIRRFIINYFTAQKPAVFIGIDSPDFNLSIEKVLKARGIKTVHYVSPTVWAWRQDRIKSIKKSVDMMLALFPFETPLYHQHQVPIHCVGHPLADKIPMISDQAQARRQLKLSPNGKIVALLPGSRAQELTYIAPTFIDTALWLLRKDPTIQFITAFPEESRVHQFKQILVSKPILPIEIFKGQSVEVMTAADAILVSSGTASLESMLVKRPTVVAYKMSSLTFAIAKRAIKVPYIALPNLLANERIMPEFVQGEATPMALGEQILHFLTDPRAFDPMVKKYADIHLELKKNAGQAAASVIKKLMVCQP